MKEKLAVKAINSKTLEITLEVPLPMIFSQLIHYTAFAVPKNGIEKFGKNYVKEGEFGF